MPVEVRTVTQAYRFALDPTPRQERAFASHVGAARFAFNWGLARTAEALDAYAAEKASGVEKPSTRIPSHFDLCKLWTSYKNAHRDLPDERGRTLGWVGENFVGTYQAALRDAATAWKNFFASRSGRRAGRRMGRPRFKSKHRARRSFQVHGDTLRVTDAHHVMLPKIGAVKTHESTRKLLRRVKDAARIVRGTVAQDSRGRWHIALTVVLQREVRQGPSARQRAGGAVGIDFGVRDVATLSDGSVIEAPRYLDQAQRKLRRLNQAMARCVIGSRRRHKARVRLGRAHGRVANLRHDATQKMTSTIVHRYRAIAIEGWDVQRATAGRGSEPLPRRLRRDRNRRLADAAVGAARWQLQSKSVWYGSTVVVTDQHAPTGRTCSACGQVRTKPVPLADELFHCPGCGHSEDRRTNTARVLAAVAAAHVAPSGGETQNARGGDISPTASRRGGRSPSKREARTRLRGRGQPGTPGP